MDTALGEPIYTALAEPIHPTALGEPIYTALAEPIHPTQPNHCHMELPVQGVYKESLVGCLDQSPGDCGGGNTSPKAL
jgi:hypothetical protein